MMKILHLYKSDNGSFDIESVMCSLQLNEEQALEVINHYERINKDYIIKEIEVLRGYHYHMVINLIEKYRLKSGISTEEYQTGLGLLFDAGGVDITFLAMVIKRRCTK